MEILNDKFIKETEKVNSYETQFIPTDVWVEKYK